MCSSSPEGAVKASAVCDAAVPGTALPSHDDRCEDNRVYQGSDSRIGDGCGPHNRGSDGGIGDGRGSHRDRGEDDKACRGSDSGIGEGRGPHSTPDAAQHSSPREECALAAVDLDAEVLVETECQGQPSMVTWPVYSYLSAGLEHDPGSADDMYVPVQRQTSLTPQASEKRKWLT